MWLKNMAPKVTMTFFLMFKLLMDRCCCQLFSKHKPFILRFLDNLINQCIVCREKSVHSCCKSYFKCYDETSFIFFVFEVAAVILGHQTPNIHLNLFAWLKTTKDMLGNAVRVSVFWVD